VSSGKEGDPEKEAAMKEAFAGKEGKEHAKAISAAPRKRGKKTSREKEKRRGFLERTSRSPGKRLEKKLV